MKTTKIVIGGIVGGISFFFLGWLIYGVLLMDFMSEFSNTTFNRPEEEMVWWAMILSNMASGFIFSIIFGWLNNKTIIGGVKIAAIIGVLFALSIDLSFYSMTTLYSSFTPIIVDIIAFTIMSAIAGGIIAWVMNIGKTEA
ncbi:MAG: hypothetical protein A2W85_10785 [Bacteroidetes bacterium GWF2_41_31]|nr:MAG: hypothetical protein A2W85_10785 [Bacteroidetes bacterium GWF2_41_31]